MSITNELPPKTALTVNRDLVKSMMDRSAGFRIADAAEAMVKIIGKMERGEQVDGMRCMDLLITYRTTQYQNFFENPARGRRLADEVRRWQAATVRKQYTGQVVPLLALTAPQAAELERVHAAFDGIDPDE